MTASASSRLATEEVPAKRQQILSGARQVFSELGFERASVDLIASRAGVSKATVYNHFADKHALYVACIAHDTDEMRAGLSACLDEPSGDVEHVLQRVGERIMAVLLSPPVVELHRHVIAEAARFPDIGRTIFEHGARVVYDAIASYLERWTRTGVLRIEEPRAAAVQFVALCQGDLVARARLALLEYPVDDEVREAVRRAVRTFLRAYRA